MPDRGHDLWFGYFLTPDAAHADAIVERARLADSLGLDLLGVQDHPYQPRFLDTWTLLSALAGQTTRIRLVPDDELSDYMVDGRFIVTCQFCNASNIFSEKEVRALRAG